MKKALIEKASNRLCQVEQEAFPVHGSLEWRDCADDVNPETHDFDGTNFVPKPLPVVPEPIDYNDFANMQKVIRAKCLSDLAFRLGKPPGQLTAEEIAAERTRIKNIADALP